MISSIMRMFRHLILYSFLGIFLSTSNGCKNESHKIQAIDPTTIVFNETRAFDDLKFLCEEIGPRRIGTEGAKKTRDWIKKNIEELKGWKFSTEDFEATPPSGAKRRGTIIGTNVFAKRMGKEKGEIWICSHYDTYDTPGFVGANDSGSSSVILLELARQLQGESLLEGMSITLCWFDGEEPFPPLPWDDDNNSTFGSRHLAYKKKEEGSLKDIRAFILLDMVGDKKLGVVKDSTSSQSLKDIFEATAIALGDSNLFVGQKAIKDDHIHFRDLGIPTIDIIDFNYGPRNSYWHTNKDILENTSAESLGRIGRLVMAALPTVNKKFKLN